MVLTYQQRKSKPNFQREHGLRVKRYAARMRQLVIEVLGGICVRCGFSDPRALQIDHVNGGGTVETRIISGTAFYNKVMQSFNAGEGKYQLLCANCNWIKRVERNEIRNGGILTA